MINIWKWDRRQGETLSYVVILVAIILQNFDTIQWKGMQLFPPHQMFC